MSIQWQDDASEIAFVQINVQDLIHQLSVFKSELVLKDFWTLKQTSPTECHWIVHAKVDKILEKLIIGKFFVPDLLTTKRLQTWIAMENAKI